MRKQSHAKVICQLSKGHYSIQQAPHLLSSDFLPGKMACAVSDRPTEHNQLLGIHNNAGGVNTHWNEIPYIYMQHELLPTKSQRIQYNRSKKCDMRTAWRYSNKEIVCERAANIPTIYTILAEEQNSIIMRKYDLNRAAIVFRIARLQLHLITLCSTHTQ